MATPAHCYYCFESLAASFDGREPPSLAAIEDLWEQYEQAKELAALNNGKNGLGQQSVEDEDVLGDQDGSNKRPYPQTLQLPSVSRLQSSDSSSASTTPSSLSISSSRSDSTAMTTPGSPADGLGFQRPRLEESGYPLFVTWNTISKSGHKSLRGCIGTFEAQEISSGLRSYALTSAFDDTRFAPIPVTLLPSLSCSLTLLGSFEPCADAMDWTLGVHGLRISFIHRGRRYGATYLPDVAVEQGWTKEETVESLMRKAGYDGGSGLSRRLLRGSSASGAGKPWEEVSNFKAVRYQGLKSSATYDEWQEWREWVKSLGDGRAKLLQA
ncbi:AMMECR1 family protein [Paecilomyces variotii No. 5]|uniref:AMMECR1 family protein n=1 Tax=Byssochlamys spectabilis (strain No. 5 / NBRC 109023) TaxID=1356009 RepID=V5I203_BYSSN|nr:AMMECR1 family protein [Paecilomyces variotii No. 5]